jgi:hypothetical protein
VTTGQAAQISPPLEAEWRGDFSVSGGEPPRDHGPGGLARRVIDILTFDVDGSLRAPVSRFRATHRYQRSMKGTA